jgi:hypothetical protein
MPTLYEAMVEAAQQGGWHAQGTASAASAASFIVIDAFTDTLRTANAFKGWFVYRPGLAVAAGDKIRRVSSFSPASGTITISGPVYGVQPDGETIDLFGLMPPRDFAGWNMTWRDCVNAALNKIWYIAEDTSFIGLTGGQDTFALTGLAGLTHARQVRDIEYRSVTQTSPLTLYNFADMNSYGRWWEVDEDSLTLRVFPSPATNETIVIQYARRYATLDADGDATAAPLDVVYKGTLSEVYERLNERYAGKFTAEHSRSLRAFNEAYDSIRPPDIILV